MLNKLRAKMLSLQFRSIRRAVIILIAKIPKDLERAITLYNLETHGFSRVYYENGNLKTEEEYDNNKLLWKKEYSEDGELKSEVKYW